MKKILFLILSLNLLYTSCNKSNNCSVILNIDKKQSCNIVVTDNKAPIWGGDGTLRFRGIDLNSREQVLYKSKSRGWRPLSDYINIGDTVVKNEGEAIMYVYKKDSIVIRNLSNMCKKDFDWKKDVYTFILRDTIK